MAVTTFRVETLESQFTANGFITYDQTNPDVISLAGGGFAVVYGNDNTINADNDFPRLDFYDADFNVVASAVAPWTDDQIFLEFAPRITELSNGNVLVVWDEGASGDNDVLGRIFTAAGVAVGGTFSVSGVAAETFPDVAGLAGGGFAVVTDDAADVFVQKYNSSGGFVSDFEIPLSGVNLDGRIEGLADGGFTVTWTNTDAARNDGDQAIYTRIFNADGTARTGDILVGEFGINKKSAIAAMPNGNFAVVYADDGYTQGDGISLHVFNANGGELTPGAVRVDVELGDIEANPDVTVFDNNFILVSWTDPSNSGDILARLFSPAGQPITVNGGGVFTLTDSGSADTFSSIAAMAGGDFIATWQDSFSDGDGGQISGLVNRIIRTVTGDGANELLIGDGFIDEISGGGGDDSLQGRDGDDSLFGDAGDDQIFGQRGDDEATGGAGRDTVSGGDGDDLLAGNDGEDQLFGGADDDTLFGGAQSDLLAGDSGADQLFGALGNDLLFGGVGGDLLHGGDGADVMNGQAGVDTLIGSTGDDTANGGDGNDHITGGNGADSLSGNLGADTIDGGMQNDFLNGGNGLDDVSGGAGDDSLFGGINNDTLDGGAGADLIAGGNGNDDISGGGGNDQMFGGAGGDDIDGGAGNDAITGVSGDDTITGGGGDDTLTGGTGDDVFVFGPGGGADTILDLQTGAGGPDKIDLSAMGAAFDTFAEVIAAASNNGADVLIDFGGGDTILLTNTQIADLHQDDFFF